MKKDKLLDELIELIEKEPEEVSLEQMAQEHFIRLFEEPEHSRTVIMNFQRKYGVHSIDIVNEEYRVLNCVSISEDDLAEWQWAIEQFTKAGGSVFDLPFSDSDEWITATGPRTSSYTEVSNEKGRRSLQSALFPSLVFVSA